MSVEKAYDSWSAQYDTNENKTRDLDRQSTMETLSRYDFKNVLELGCGTGKNTAYLLQKASKVIGLDFSQEMLHLAKAKITDTRVQFKKGDLTKTWEIENEFADLITSSLTLEHIKKLDHIFQQASRVLKKDGFFFISELHPFKQYSGSQARFETEEGEQKVAAYVHHLSEYLAEAKKSNFKLIEIKEWFDQLSDQEIPRLISFVFQK